MECFELYFWHCSCTVAHRCSGTVVHSDCSGTGTVALQWLQWRCIANCILHPGPAAAFTLMLKYQKCSALMLKYYHLLDYSTLLWLNCSYIRNALIWFSALIWIDVVQKLSSGSEPMSRYSVFGAKNLARTQRRISPPALSEDAALNSLYLRKQANKRTEWQEIRKMA